MGVPIIPTRDAARTRWRWASAGPSPGHTHHKDPPKRNFKLGDVMDGVGVRIALDPRRSSLGNVLDSGLSYRLYMPEIAQMERRPPAPRADRYLDIFEHSNDAIFIIDPGSDRILEANPRAGAMLGYTHEELLATPISAVHPNEMPRMLAFTETVLREGHGWTDDLTCRTKAGEFLPAEISASVVEMAGRTCVVAMVRDIAERKRMEAALRDSEERLSRVLDSAMDAIIAVDEKLRITLFNKAAESTFRCPAAVALGTPLRSLISDRFKDLLEVSVKEFAHSGWKKHYMWAEALTAFRADGEPFAVDITLSPFEHAERAT